MKAEITDKKVIGVMELFSDEQKYKDIVEPLMAIRSLAGKVTTEQTEEGERPDLTHPLFWLRKGVNDIIGYLCLDDIHPSESWSLTGANRVSFSWYGTRNDGRPSFLTPSEASRIARMADDKETVSGILRMKNELKNVNGAGRIQRIAEALADALMLPDDGQRQPTALPFVMARIGSTKKPVRRRMTLHVPLRVMSV